MLTLLLPLRNCTEKETHLKCTAGYISTFVYTCVTTAHIQLEHTSPAFLGGAGNSLRLLSRGSLLTHLEAATALIFVTMNWIYLLWNLISVEIHSMFLPESGFFHSMSLCDFSVVLCASVGCSFSVLCSIPSLETTPSCSSVLL